MSFERYLGRRLTGKERGSVRTLNDLPVAAMDEAARIAAHSRSAAAMYLGELVGRGDLDDASRFVDEVIIRGVDPRTWGVADRLCIRAPNLPELVTLPGLDLLSPLDRVVGDRWWVERATQDTWDHSGFTGAPGVIVRAAPYCFEGPRESNWIEVGAMDLRQITDLTTTLRRWIASRVAWELRLRPHSEKASVDGWCAALAVPRAGLSEDGAVALGALVRELDLGEAVPPGFRGPDVWYT